LLVADRSSIPPPHFTMQEPAPPTHDRTPADPTTERFLDAIDTLHTAQGGPSFDQVLGVMRELGIEPPVGRVGRQPELEPVVFCDHA